METATQVTHTSGLWEKTGGSRFIHANGNVICRMGSGNRGPTVYARYYIEKQEFEANASLIASAPELLEACKKALKVLRLDSDMEEDFALEINTLEQAIVKAEKN